MLSHLFIGSHLRLQILYYTVYFVKVTRHITGIAMQSGHVQLKFRNKPRIKFLIVASEIQPVEKLHHILHGYASAVSAIASLIIGYSKDCRTATSGDR